MKRKNDFTEGSIAKHGTLELSSKMHFVFKLVLLTLAVLMLTSSFIVLETLAEPFEEIFKYSLIQVSALFF